MTSQHPIESSQAPAAFVTTKWTQVLEARGSSPEATTALGDLCAAYYAPVFAFIRQSARDEETARDLTQEFFARMLARGGIGAAEPGRGRFRSFLLGAVKHFLADMHDYTHRLKRGAGRPMESLNGESDTSAELQVADPGAPAPDREFDRKWALTLLDRALQTLAREHELAGKSGQFEILKPWLTGDAGVISQAEAAAQMGVNEGAVKVAVHRLRRRFREALKHEIAQTVDDPQQVDTEMHCLLEALL